LIHCNADFDAQHGESLIQPIMEFARHTSALILLSVQQSSCQKLERFLGSRLLREHWLDLFRAMLKT
jgi:hypothetical protein